MSMVMTACYRGLLQQTTMQALTLAMHDAAYAHRQHEITSQAATVRAIPAMLGEPSPDSTPVASNEEPSNGR